MLIYIVLFGMMAFASFLDITSLKAVYKKYIILILGIFICICAGLRWETGTDWDPYILFYSRNNDLNDFFYDIVKFEPGYAFLNWIIKSLFDSYSVVLLSLTVIIVYCKYTIIRNYAYYPLMALLINFANSNGDIFPVRQMVALGICIYSVSYIIGKKKFKFILGVLFASTLHVSALLFLFAYPIYYINIKVKHIIGLLLLAGIFGALGIVDALFNQLLLYGLGTDITTFNKVMDYQEITQNGGMDDTAVSGSIVFLLGVVRRSLFVPVLLYFRREISKKYPIYTNMLNLYCFSIWLMILFSGSLSSIIGRITIYYFWFEALLLPGIILVVNKKYKIIMWFILVIYCAIKYIWGFSIYPDLFIPYKTILG